MEHVNLLVFVFQIGPLIGTEDAQRQGENRPEVHDSVMATVMLTEFVNLGMTVMTSGNAIIRTGSLDLLVLDSAILQTLILESRLEESTAAAATEVIGLVGRHVDKVLFSYRHLDSVSQIIRYSISETLSYNLAGILNRKFNFQILVPIGIGFEFSFPNPLGIIFVNILNLKIVLDSEFFQSGPDCESDVPSLGV